MSEQFKFLLQALFLGQLVLLLLTSCNWSFGKVNDLGVDKQVCTNQLIHAFFGELPEKKSLCSPIEFKIKKSSDILNFRGQHTQGHFDISLTNNPKELFLQAPHIWADEGTGLILKKLTKKLNPKISFKNSVHRNHISPNKKRAYFDLGKQKNSILVLLSKAFIKAFPGGNIVQVHGFVSQKRKTVKGKHADVIVSSGSYQPTRKIISLAQCLKRKNKKLQVFVFPTEVTELGGTKNVLSKWSSKNGKSSFVHIEMSKRYRRFLLENNETLNHLSFCIEAMSYVKK